MNSIKFQIKFIRGFFKNWSIIKRGIYYTVIIEENLEELSLSKKVKALLSDFRRIMSYQPKIECTPTLYNKIKQTEGEVNWSGLIKDELESKK